MSRDNRLWGTERIRGVLLKLGIVVSKRSIRRYRLRKPTPGGSQTWRTFLSNELKRIWAADLLVVQTINYRVLYVLFVIRLDRREMIHFNATSSPTAAWVWQQLIEATPWGRQPKYLIHDRDAYGHKFGGRLARLGIASVRTPVRAPRANAIAERLVPTLRSEALDHIIVLNEHHLRAVLGEFVTYYNRDRPHRSLGLQSPQPQSQLPSERWSEARCWAAFTMPTLEPPELDALLPPFRLGSRQTVSATGARATVCLGALAGSTMLAEPTLPTGFQPTRSPAKACTTARSAITWRNWL
jgi:transposase InsO family protein